MCGCYWHGRQAVLCYLTYVPFNLWEKVIMPWWKFIIMWLIISPIIGCMVGQFCAMSSVGDELPITESGAQHESA